MSFYPCRLAAGKLEGMREVRQLAAEQAGDELFGLPPEEFVAARDDLARRLKREGDAVVAMVVIPQGENAGFLLTACVNGYGKRSPLTARCTVSDNSETARRSRRWNKNSTNSSVATSASSTQINLRIDIPKRSPVVISASFVRSILARDQNSVIPSRSHSTLTIKVSDVTTSSATKRSAYTR